MSIAPQSGAIPIQNYSIQSLALWARELGSERIHDEARVLAQRIAEGRFYVACVGQFKRGKSTLLSALLGERLLPAGVLPITAVLTVVRYGASSETRVRFRDGSWRAVPVEDLVQFVSEELNHENENGVTAVEVFSMSPLLANGMCLVDTPGLGSVFSGNAAATRAFVPHIDAALVVLGADPPIAGEEMALVREIDKHAKNLIIVFNKADRTSDEDRAAARSFTLDILGKTLAREVGPIYEVSAEERLTHTGPERDWDQLVAALEDLVLRSGKQMVQDAGERGFRRLSNELRATISEQLAALLRPVEESKQRIQRLGQTISEADRSLRDLGYLFMAEEHRLSDMFLNQRKQFLADIGPSADFDFRNELRNIPRRYGPRFRRAAMRLAQSVSARHLQPWLTSEQALAEREYGRVAIRFTNIANEFLTKVSDSEALSDSRLPIALNCDRGFEVPSRFTFEHLLRVAMPASPLRYIADVFLGAVRGFGLIEADAQSFLRYLLKMNSIRVQSEVVRRVQESRAQLETTIRRLLREVTQIAEHAFERAKAVRAKGQAAVSAESRRLEGLSQAICEAEEASVSGVVSG